VVRACLGGSYARESGLRAGFSVHYLSSYRMPLMNPDSVLDPPYLMPLGDSLMLFGQLAYRVEPAEGHGWEVGLFVNTPLGSPFREYAGVPMPSYLGADTRSDFGGELLRRLVSFYLRGTF